MPEHDYTTRSPEDEAAWVEWEKDNALEEREAVDEYRRQGHTHHCACRMVWGDGECECRFKDFSSRPCQRCGCAGEIHGVEVYGSEDPWTVSCTGCGWETCAWAYQHEAWAQWALDI